MKRNKMNRNDNANSSSGFSKTTYHKIGQYTQQFKMDAKSGLCSHKANIAFYLVLFLSLVFIFFLVCCCQCCCFVISCTYYSLYFCVLLLCFNGIHFNEIMQNHFECTDSKCTTNKFSHPLH